MNFDHRARLPRTGNAATADRTLAPGKRTLTEQLVVQRREGATPSGAESGTNATVPSTPAPLPAAASSRPRPALQMLFDVRSAPAENPAQVHAHEAAHVVQADTGDRLCEAPVQRKATSVETTDVDALPADGTGNPLPAKVQAKMEQAFATDFSAVRIHEGARSEALGARAYARGTDIHFAPGQYQPDSDSGQELLGHELAHVVQQSQGRVATTTQAKGVSMSDDPALEREADDLGARAARGERVAEVATTAGSALAATIQRAPWDANRAADEANETNSQNARLGAPAPHPVNIGAQQDPLNALQTLGNQKHFDPEMLSEVRSLLNYLPAEHVIGNPALGQVVCERATAANPGVSYFGGGQLHVVVPGDVDSWIYLSVDKWPLGDLVTTLMVNAGYSMDPNNPNLGPKYHQALNRDVIGRGTLSSKLSMIGENFVRWMLTHETGHSVDAAIGFMANGHYRAPWCGQWMIHDGTDQTEVGMMNTMLGGLGLTPNLAALDAQYLAATGASYVAPVLQQAIVNKDPAVFAMPGRNAALAGFDGLVPGGRALVEYLEKAIKEGLDSPWQKGDRGGVPFGGRNYHVEYQHTRWVSYDAAKYALRNSNYQYSGPDELFAESYAHYFKHSDWKFWRTAHGQWGEKLRDPAIRAWFLANLDPVNGPGALIAGNVLQPIAGPGPAPVAPPMAGAVAPPAAPGLLERLGRGFVTISELGANGLLRILATVFGLTGGALKYLLYVPVRKLWRWFKSLF